MQLQVHHFALWSDYIRYEQETCVGPVAHKLKNVEKLAFYAFWALFI